MIYHIFNYRINGIWYRDSYTYSDAQFDAIMDRLDWKLPMNMLVYHYGSPGPEPYEMNNPVILSRPVLSLNPLSLTVDGIAPAAILHDTQRRERFKVCAQSGRFVLCREAGGWPRFYYVDGITCRLSVTMTVVPLSFLEAKSFVDHNHRHNSAPQGHKFSIGLTADGIESYIGVAIASIPKARFLNDGLTLEINRVCCDPIYENACSKLYGAAIAAGKAMGYRRFVTYTLLEESGSSVRAVGFRYDGNTAAKPDGWNCRGRPRTIPQRYPMGAKQRWILTVP